ncbi:ECU11_1425 [Encephalitozoon cuniculi GB-M1]|uniref:ECU11_1425 protein n=1 Tax=Encephalitozoon cuniculi (strain GB-M1) TaxID=284813 RepID=I7JU10_ENCCU|nr:uncharacterized protein ECU11_1425 [Encephalitozoon cuniculi GB-M1]UYI26349.1 hypothetical protein J0A71_01g01690 [Encephalitozoon cuniculi]CCI73999.1 ECU11_1425 [Encephalitozoon cuniculi GB-M1]
MACYEIQRDDYIKYVDGTPFLVYTSLTLVMAMLSVFSVPSLFVYSFIPMFMAVAVGPPKQDRALLSILGCMMAFLAPACLKR